MLDKPKRPKTPYFPTQRFTLARPALGQRRALAALAALSALPCQRAAQQPRGLVAQRRRGAHQRPGIRLGLLAGRQKVLQDGRVVQGVGAASVELGVPLRCGNVAAPRRRFEANGLGHAVGLAQGFDDKVRRHPFDALVVDAVDPRARLVGVQLGQVRSLDDLDVVEMLVVHGGVAVLERARVLRLQVLVERAAKRHVDQLQAPADPEDRLAHLRKGLDHRHENERSV